MLNLNKINNDLGCQRLSDIRNCIIAICIHTGENNERTLVTDESSS